MTNSTATSTASRPWLLTQPKVQRVFYAGLPAHPGHALAKAQQKGFGGVVTQLTNKQADYIGVTVEGPFKPDSYRY